MTFQRAMTLSDWEIFFRYSSRVRSLTGFEPSRFCSSLDSNVIFSLSHPPQYGPLVPCLQTLIWGKSKKEYAPLLQLLFTHSLVDATLPCFALCLPEISMQLTSRCPSLKKINIQIVDAYGSFSNTPHADSHPMLHDTLLRLHSLESVRCLSSTSVDSLTEDFMVHLFRRLSLIEVSLYLPNDLRLANIKPHLSPPAFASIEFLTLSCKLSTLTSLLEHIHFKPRSVTFTVIDACTPDAFHSFSIALANACDSKQLSQITLTMETEWLYDRERQDISLTTFQPLLMFPNVDSFTFDVICNISFDDHVIETLTKHWPKLTKFSLNPTFGWGIESQVTHHGLITLLSCCVGLVDVAITVDFTEIDRPHPLIPKSRPGNGFTTVGVPTSLHQRSNFHR
ncbi:hypothetical protein JVU11DRAFT_6907 [Chiua virens]|nr:hypothetical protein JVU11DRAFT_6907 [Chiua virens]